MPFQYSLNQPPLPTSDPVEDGFLASLPAESLKAAVEGDVSERVPLTEATVKHHELTATPGFLREAATHPRFGIGQMLGIRVALCNAEEPSWIVGDPTITANVLEDGGNTMRVPAPFRFYAIRDDHDAEGYYAEFAEAEHRVTFMLPKEY